MPKKDNWSKNFRCNSCQYVETVKERDLFCVRSRNYKGDFTPIITFKCPKCFRKTSLKDLDIPHNIRIRLPIEQEWERRQKGIKISCGALIYYNDKLLVCRPSWEEERWDIPKGVQDNNENTLVTAIREIFEETNIKINANCGITKLGKVPYQKKKDLFIFKIILDQEPKELKCNSFFTKNKKQIPEMVDYKWIDPEKRHEYFSENLNRAINIILGENNGSPHKDNTV